MPVLEAYVSLFEVREELLGIRTSCSAGEAVDQMFGWWGLLYTFVDEVAARLSVLLR